MNDYKEHVTVRTFSKKEESLQESIKVEVSNNSTQGVWFKEVK